MLVQPDVFVVPLDQAGLKDWAHIGHLLLAVETVWSGNRAVPFSLDLPELFGPI